MTLESIWEIETATLNKMQDDLLELSGIICLLEEDGVFVKLKAKRQRSVVMAAPSNPSGRGALFDV